MNRRDKRRSIISDEIVESLPPDPTEESYSGFVQKFAHEEVKVKVYRQTPAGKQYCFLGSPSEIDDEAIRLYHARQSYAHQDGMCFIHVLVRDELRSVFPVPIAPQVATPGHEEQHGGMASDTSMIRLLMDQNERLERRLLRWR